MSAVPENESRMPADAWDAPGARGAGRGRLARAAAGLSRLADGVAALALFVLMSLSFADVVGREALARPLSGTVELTELLMATMIFAVLPSISRRGDHVVIDLLDAWVPRWLRPVQRVAANGLGAVAFAVIGWQLWDDAGKLARYGGTTPYFELPLAPVVQLMAVMAACAAVGFAAAMFSDPKDRS